GIKYERTQKTVMATATKGIRVTATKSLLVRVEGTKTVNGNELMEPFNTLVTVKKMKVTNG
ncbi:hypothetical protein ACQ4OG_10990, partial [Escherichia coli]